MKKIYRKAHTLYINNKPFDVKSFHFRWFYGDIPEKQDLIFTDFNEFYNSVSGWSQVWRGATWFNNKTIKTVGKPRTITKANFKNANWERSYEEIDTSIFSLSELMERLSAKDFIEYCKDNGLTVCPIT